ncbi:diguanylate cyclase [Pelomonas sp. V22]|uniref:sensor domain-containing diguanylate cyclase n=1 Tax=Pelomonas sp. V22 TaxID=2822139 RepID=UPI0024A985E6|nr:sensor domain-containing diguanylate cyclase [Pelomonas sp. V22]MDI4631481.1 diguanylate cyclase [Pelomonas sp. V22]
MSTDLRSSPLPSVASVLRRAQLRVALLTLLVVGSVLIVGMLVSLRLNQLKHLNLVAQSLAYTSEAAVVFRDARSAAELLADAGARDELAGARIVLASGASLAQWQRPARWPRLEAAVDMLLPLHAEAEIRFQAEVVGRLQLRGDVAPLLVALGWSLAAAALGMLLSGKAVMLMTRRLTQMIEAPLSDLAAQSRHVREARAYRTRVRGASIREIDALANDLNALLDEVLAREAELLHRHEALQSDHADLAERASRDSLTGVANRAHFEHRLVEALARADAGGTRLALLFIDADRFKQINDQHGHEAGDQVLIALAQRVRSAVREHDLVARLGGDEFVVLIEPLRHADDAHRVTQQIEALVARPLALPTAAGPIEITPGISVGVALYPDHGHSAEALLRHADESMYRRKRVRRLNPAEQAVSDVSRD